MMTDFYEKEREEMGEREKKVKLQKGMDEGEEGRKRERAKKIK